MKPSADQWSNPRLPRHSALLLTRVPVKPMEFYVSNPGCSCRVLQGPASVAIVHGPCHAAKMFKDAKEATR